MAENLENVCNWKKKVELWHSWKITFFLLIPSDTKSDLTLMQANLHKVWAHFSTREAWSGALLLVYEKLLSFQMIYATLL